MLTYELTKNEGPLYETLYKFIKKDITHGVLKSGDRMPSKRSLAENLGVSSITVENAYNQLIDEGYLYSLPKRGYFVGDISDMIPEYSRGERKTLINLPKEESQYIFDFSSNRNDYDSFPFSVWTKLMRETISGKEEELLKVSPPGGIYKLREAIANHLLSFRGIAVDPNQIIVGAGTEYLYSLLIKLLGNNKQFAVENPGYEKITKIYESSGVTVKPINMDLMGMDVTQLNVAGADIAHVSPTHHYPTGITMPLSRRKELLSWANEKSGRYIIEDEYDSEFRLKGRPLPPLLAIDSDEKVIYMNTFSKSLTSTIRISYMVLPCHLANEFYEKLYFYSNTVSTFEQATLAEFIGRGYFEKHINRMRLHYARKRKLVLDILESVFTTDECEIIEEESGLHFIMKLKTDYNDKEVEEILTKEGIRIVAVSDFDRSDDAKMHYFILNYSALDTNGLKGALDMVRNLVVNK